MKSMREKQTPNHPICVFPKNPSFLFSLCGRSRTLAVTFSSDTAICPEGSYCRLLITSSHSRSYTSTSPHKFIIYGNCFPEISIRKARAALDGESMDCTSSHISVACQGLPSSENQKEPTTVLSHFLSLYAQGRIFKNL